MTTRPRSLAGALALLCFAWSCSTSTDTGGGDPTVSPCTQAHLFCDDFDKGELGAAWEDKDLSGGPLTTDTTRYRSAPHALRAQSPASPSPRSVVLYKNTPEPPGKLRCSFDVMVLARAGGYADIFELRLDLGAAGSGSYYYAYLQVTENGTFVGQETVLPEGKVANLTPVADLPIGQWRRIQFETNFTSFTVSYEGEPSHVETMRRTGTKPQIALGLVFTEGGGPFDLLFDNLACDHTP